MIGVNVTRKQSVLVTGANSGLGYEAAAQFAEAGYERVILVSRTLDRARDAKARLVARVGRDVFEPIGADISDIASVDAAARELIAAGRAIDVLILNAGVLPPDKPSRTRDGYDLGHGAALIGHHRLTTHLLGAGLIAKDGRIVIAGSEAARGDVAGVTLPDYRGIADTKYGGDLEQTLSAFLRGDEPTPRVRMSVYAISKLMVAWWAASLSRTLPQGTTVNAVSPGGTPATNFARDGGFVMKTMMAVMSTVGPLFGIMHSIPVGARRYFTATHFGPNVNGQFFASRPKKFSGELVPVDTAAVSDEEAQAALWSLLSVVTADQKEEVEMAAVA